MKIGKSYSKRFALLACLVPVALQAAAPPKVGDKAPDFLLQTLDNQAIRLGDRFHVGRLNVVIGIEPGNLLEFYV